MMRPPRLSALARRGRLGGRRGGRRVRPRGRVHRLFRHHEPHDRVREQRDAPGEHGGRGEDHPNERRVDIEVAAKAARDAGDHAIGSGPA